MVKFSSSSLTFSCNKEVAAGIVFGCLSAVTVDASYQFLMVFLFPEIKFFILKWSCIAKKGMFLTLHMMVTTTKDEQRASDSFKFNAKSSLKFWRSRFMDLFMARI